MPVKMTERREKTGQRTVKSLPAHVVLRRHPSFKSTVILTGDFDGNYTH